MRKFATLLLAFLMAPLTAFAQGAYGDVAPQYNTNSVVATGGGMTFAQFVGELIGLINTIIPVLISIGLLIFFIGLIKYVYNQGDAHGHNDGKKFIIWGLIAMFVMLSLWGILDVAKTSIFAS